MVVSVEKLYTDYDVLSAGKASEAEVNYKELKLSVIE